MRSQHIKTRKSGDFHYFLHTRHPSEVLRELSGYGVAFSTPLEQGTYTVKFNIQATGTGNRSFFISLFDIDANGNPINIVFPVNAQNIANGNRTYTYTNTNSTRTYMTYGFYLYTHTPSPNNLTNRFFTLDNLEITFTGNILLTECLPVGTDLAEYRYGFNGMEKDDEVKGKGKSYTTEFRQYDPRLGRWLSLDPEMVKYPDWSPYSFSFNNPIWWNDPDGDDPDKEQGESHQEEPKPPFGNFKKVDAEREARNIAIDIIQNAINNSDEFLRVSSSNPNDNRIIRDEISKNISVKAIIIEKDREVPDKQNIPRTVKVKEFEIQSIQINQRENKGSSGSKDHTNTIVIQGTKRLVKGGFNLMKLSTVGTVVTSPLGGSELGKGSSLSEQQGALQTILRTHTSQAVEAIFNSLQ